MPITRPAVINHTLVNLVVDMPGQYMLATFDRTIDGQGQGSVQMRIDGADLFSIIGRPGSSQVTVGDAITDAVYEYAISTGGIQGVIVQPVPQILMPQEGM